MQRTNQTGMKSTKTGTKSSTHSMPDSEAVSVVSGGGEPSPGAPNTSGNQGNQSQTLSSSGKRKNQGQHEEKTSTSQKKSKTSKTPVPSTSSGGTTSGGSETPAGNTTKGKEDDTTMCSMISKWHHHPQPPAMRASLLEKVLNEKKLALMQSPEVIKWLQEQQQDVEKEHLEKPASILKDRLPKNARSIEPIKSSSDTSYRGPRVLLGRESADSASKGSLDQSGDDESDSGEAQQIISHSIWSREASAFSSVSRTNQTK